MRILEILYLKDFVYKATIFKLNPEYYWIWNEYSESRKAEINEESFFSVWKDFLNNDMYQNMQ